MHINGILLTFCDAYSVVGVPSADDWPQEVALPQSAFAPRPPKPIENLVPDMDELGRSLLMVSLNGGGCGLMWCCGHTEATSAKPLYCSAADAS